MTNEDFYLDDYDDSFEVCGYRLKSGATCGQPTHSVSECEQCGKPLCMMCAESGGQFCESCPTEDYDPMKLMEDEIV